MTGQHRIQSWPDFVRNIRARQGVLVAIDHGTRRIGLAASDPKRRVAIPWMTSVNALPPLILNLQQRTIAGIIVGWPRNMDGSEGPQCRIVEGFLTRLTSTLPTIPVTTLDERLTSQQASNTGYERRQRRPSRGRSSKRISTVSTDEAAAVILLDTALQLLAHTTESISESS